MTTWIMQWLLKGSSSNVIALGSAHSRSSRQHTSLIEAAKVLFGGRLAEQSNTGGITPFLQCLSLLQPTQKVLRQSACAIHKELQYLCTICSLGRVFCLAGFHNGYSFAFAFNTLHKPTWPRWLRHGVCRSLLDFLLLLFPLQPPPLLSCIQHSLPLGYAIQFSYSLHIFCSASLWLFCLVFPNPCQFLTSWL